MSSSILLSKTPTRLVDESASQFSNSKAYHCIEFLSPIVILAFPLPLWQIEIYTLLPKPGTALAQVVCLWQALAFCLCARDTCSSLDVVDAALWIHRQLRERGRESRCKWRRANVKRPIQKPSAVGCSKFPLPLLTYTVLAFDWLNSISSLTKSGTGRWTLDRPFLMIFELLSRYYGATPSYTLETTTEFDTIAELSHLSCILHQINCLSSWDCPQP